MDDTDPQSKLIYAYVCVHTLITHLSTALNTDSAVGRVVRSKANFGSSCGADRSKGWVEGRWEWEAEPLLGPEWSVNGRIWASWDKLGDTEWRGAVVVLDCASGFYLGVVTFTVNFFPLKCNFNVYLLMYVYCVSMHVPWRMCGGQRAPRPVISLFSSSEFQDWPEVVRLGSKHPNRHLAGSAVLVPLFFSSTQTLQTTFELSQKIFIITTHHVLPLFSPLCVCDVYVVCVLFMMCMLFVICMCVRYVYYLSM